LKSFLILQQIIVVHLLNQIVCVKLIIL